MVLKQFNKFYFTGQKLKKNGYKNLKKKKTVGHPVFEVNKTQEILKEELNVEKINRTEVYIFSLLKTSRNIDIFTT